MTDKYRVFVATYFRQGITSDKRNRTILKYATYHWAIWIEGKKSTGPGYCFDVKEHPPFSNVPNSGGWKYECRHENLAESHGMLGRMMIGKLPKGVTVQDVDGLLQGIPLPKPNSTSVENRVSWVQAAVRVLQEKSWADDFDVDELMNHVFNESDKWYQENENLQDKPKIANYTNRPL
ncbi:hypothetical protein TMEN_113 [Trichophyton mentagrophytes]|uniref:Uncharacterized protein n=1 Tax=Trichophyton interdigitale (strain MR816) TaxID=1215338 RepID=A0A059J5D0_TRIIM|nr:hypothetical protein H101_04991 [Trichophyton interdigitale H6]KDB23081.1 hypothetical protein H109_05039 [Trichophyton interdigitale MR816]GBF59500.1 hypothetical protein TMEN_113 [Trichophyton mentagrophytes]